MNSIRFTIVTVCYNAGQVIKKTMESVLKQTYKNVEYLIIDGNSKDDTIDIANRVAAGYPECDIKIISENDNGVYDAMNKAILLANGDYINYMNAGDTFFTYDVLDKVAKMVNTTVDVIFGDEVVSFDGVLFKVKADPFYNHLPLHHSMGFNHQCTFVKTGVANKFPFDLKYRLAADYNMIITIYRNGGSFQYIDCPIACYDTNGMSSQNIKIHILETLFVDNPNTHLANIIKANFLYFRYCVGQFLKKFVIMSFPQIVKKKHLNDKRVELI